MGTPRENPKIDRKLFLVKGDEGTEYGAFGERVAPDPYLIYYATSMLPQITNLKPNKKSPRSEMYGEQLARSRIIAIIGMQRGESISEFGKTRGYYPVLALEDLESINADNPREIELGGHQIRAIGLLAAASPRHYARKRATLKQIALSHAEELSTKLRANFVNLSDYRDRYFPRPPGGA